MLFNLSDGIFLYVQTFFPFLSKQFCIFHAGLRSQGKKSQLKSTEKQKTNVYMTIKFYLQKRIMDL